MDGLRRAAAIKILPNTIEDSLIKFKVIDAIRRNLRSKHYVLGRTEEEREEQIHDGHVKVLRLYTQKYNIPASSWTLSAVYQQKSAHLKLKTGSRVLM